MAQQIPMSQADVTGEAQDDGTIEVAPDLAYLRLAIVNAVFWGKPGARDWVLIDAGDIVVHLFKPDARALYALEKMWGPDLDEHADAPVAS